MKIGDLVYDTVNGDIVVIIRDDPHWQEFGSSLGRKSGINWDFEVMSKSGVYYADKDELALIEEINAE